MDCSLPGFSIHGISQSSVLGCIAISYKGSNLSLLHLVAGRLFTTETPEKPLSKQFLLLFSHSVMSDSLRPHGLQHTRPPCPSPSPGVYSNSCPSSWWCHPTISSSVIPFSSHLQSFPASGSFPMSLFTSGGQSTGASASASVLPVNKMNKT